MQDAEHHEVDDVAVGVADGHTQQRHHGEAQPGQNGVNEIQERRDEQEQELDRFGSPADHAGHYAGDQQALNLMAVFRLGAVVHRQRRPRQTAEEGRHLALGQEAGGAFSKAGGGRARQLRLENGQRAAHAMAADVQRAARFGKADQRHQNMLQAER
ncbi:hypothetical protein D3C78_1412400 [compost metagenome]